MWEPLFLGIRRGGPKSANFFAKKNPENSEFFVGPPGLEPGTN